MGPELAAKFLLEKRFLDINAFRDVALCPKPEGKKIWCMKCMRHECSDCGFHKLGIQPRPEFADKQVYPHIPVYLSKIYGNSSYLY